MSEKSSTTYTVVARRYRPQTFRDLVGQEHIVTALSNAIQQKRVGHAYLFTGARGTGKTSSARIFAKCLNCQQGPTPQPCNECDVCLSIASGEDVDVLEIDGASNRGIDEIRQLRSNVNIRPSRSRFKIYIIDEVHMLTKEAFNALLKTLEEPPEHVKFFFCTTDPQKLPITVLSRCQRYDFVPVATAEITQRLREIATSEGVAAEESALVMLARRAAGSMRDSQSLLEQVLAYCEEKITVADVHALLGTADSGKVFALIEAMLGRRAGEALSCIAEAIAEGCDAGQLASQLIAYYRDLMVLRVGGETALLLAVDDADAGRLQSLGAGVALNHLLSSLQILDQALVRMQSCTHSRIILEAAVLRVSELADLQSLVETIRQVQDSANSPAAGKASSPAIPTSGVAGHPAKKKVELSPANANAMLAEADSGSPDEAHLAHGVPPLPANQPGRLGATSGNPNPTSQLGGTKFGASSDTGEPSREALADRPQGEVATGQLITNPEALWRKTLAELGDFTADVAAEYRKVESREPDSLTVTLTAEYQVQLCNRAERRQRVEECLARIAGRKIRIDFIAAPQAPSMVKRREPVNRRQVIKRLEQLPTVKRWIAMFDGEVTDFELPRNSGD